MSIKPQLVAGLISKILAADRVENLLTGIAVVEVLLPKAERFKLGSRQLNLLDIMVGVGKIWAPLTILTSHIRIIRHLKRFWRLVMVGHTNGRVR